MPARPRTRRPARPIAQLALSQVPIPFTVDSGSTAGKTFILLDPSFVAAGGWLDAAGSMLQWINDFAYAPYLFVGATAHALDPQTASTHSGNVIQFQTGFSGANMTFQLQDANGHNGPQFVSTLSGWIDTSTPPGVRDDH